MEVTSKDIKEGILLTFKDIIYHENGNSSLIPEENGYLVKGILKDDYFLDIETSQVYRILFIDEEGDFTVIPKVGEPYIYGVQSYSFKSDEEKDTLLNKAQCTLDVYEGKGNVVSFEKYKKKREDKRWCR